MIRAASKEAVEATASEVTGVGRKPSVGRQSADVQKAPPDSAANCPEDVIPPGQHAHPLGFFRPQNAAEQTVFKRKQNARYVVVWCSSTSGFHSPGPSIQG